MNIDPGTYDLGVTYFLLGVTIICFLWVFLERKGKSILPLLVIGLYTAVLLMVGVNEYQYAKAQENAIMEDLGYFNGVVDPEEDSEIDPDIWINSETYTGTSFEIISDEYKQSIEREI